MAPELVSASARVLIRVLILGGGVLVGRTLELLPRSADIGEVPGRGFSGKAGAGELGLLDTVRLLILAPEASAGAASPP